MCANHPQSTHPLSAKQATFVNIPAHSGNKPPNHSRGAGGRAPRLRTTLAVQKVNDIFGAALARYSRQPEFRAGMAALAWEKVLGRDVAQHVQLARIDNGTAWVRTSSPVWAHQLTFLKADILGRLATILGPDAIKDIRIARAPARSKETGQEAPPPDEPLTAEQASLVAHCADQVWDDRLSEALKRAMEAVMRRQAMLEKRGFLSCLDCGALTDDPERRCFLCRRESRRVRRDKLVGLLREKPWASLWDVRAHVADLEGEEYGKLRAQLLRTTWADIQSWLDRNKRAVTLTPAIAEEVKLHVMLRVLRPWDRIGAQTVEHYAGKKLRLMLERGGMIGASGI